MPQMRRALAFLNCDQGPDIAYPGFFRSPADRAATPLRSKSRMSVSHPFETVNPADGEQ